MKVNTDTGIISAQGYMEEELSNELRCSSSPKWTQKMIINYLYF